MRGDGEGLLRAIAARLPGLRLLTDPVDRESYRRDETAYLPAGLPLAVALPETTADVEALVRLCGEHDVPIVARGAGTGLSGGAAGIEGALTIAFGRMNRVLEIDHENLTVTTQPGVVNADLKAAVAAEGLFYAPDPASYETCTIGGNLGTNAGGLCCVKYGVTRDAVLGLEVVMADGAVLRLGGKNVKDVAGYGLMPLLVGSQGTLGLITEATLRLRPAPPPRSTMIAFFPTLAAAGQAVAGLTAAGLGPVTLELMDRFTIRAVDDVHRLGLDRDAAAMLLVESDLPGAAAAAEIDAAEPVCDRRGGHRSSSGPPIRRRPTGSARAAGSPSARSSTWARPGWRTSACPGAGCPSCCARSRPSPSATGSPSARSGTRATATSTRRSSSTAARVRPPPSSGSRPPGPTSTRPRSTSAGR